jgi:predicted TPR repeat methyltransferase
MSGTPEIWKATYEATTVEELAQAYSEWAEDYEKDTLDIMGYVGPQNAVSMLDRHLASKQVRVLDAGCGTGLVGQALNQMGYREIDAMDYSRDMLEQAKRKQVYRRCFTEDMSQTLDVADNSYDATICVGTFTYAHVGPEAFDELVRITRPGGMICFTIRDGAYQEYNYRARMLEMEAENIWKLIEMREKDYLVKEQVTAKFCAYQVLAT